MNRLRNGWLETECKLKKQIKFALKEVDKLEGEAKGLTRANTQLAAETQYFKEKLQL